MCNYCDFEYPEHEYDGEELKYEIKVDGTKQYYKITIHEDYEYDHFINIQGTYSNILIPIKYCPICGKKLE